MPFSKLRRQLPRQGCHPSAGFGLIELMVSVSIVALVSAVILSRNTSFNGAVLLRNQAFELAFAVRQAQLLAVSGNTGLPGDTRRYGVYINTSTAEQGNYLIFQDNNTGNVGYYDSSEDTVIGTRGRLDGRFEIRGVTNLAGVSQTGGGANTGFSITFVRPNFDAKFKNQANANPAGPVYIDVAQLNKTGNTTGEVRRVEVTSTGQVQVTTY